MATLAAKARDAGQLDLFALAPVSTHRHVTIIDQAALVEADDFASFPAQEIGKRALEIAAVHNHYLQFIGTCAEIDALIRAGRKVGATRCVHASDACWTPLDLNVEIAPTPEVDLRSPLPSEPSAVICARVAAAQAIRQDITLLEEPAAKLMDDARAAMRFDDAAELRIMAVARSIAALAGARTVGRIHIAEALAYCRMPPRAAPAI